MANIIEGSLSGEGLKVGIVSSRFNDFITGKLVDGALDALERHGVKGEHIDIARVPGAFEIPSVARRLAESGKYHAIVCLGTVIRGATPHFDYVAGETAKGLGRLALESQVPVIFGVLTTDTIEQAIERAGTKAGNKGWETAMAAIEMANLFKNIESGD